MNKVLKLLALGLLGVMAYSDVLAIDPGTYWKILKGGKYLSYSDGTAKMMDNFRYYNTDWQFQVSGNLWKAVGSGGNVYLRIWDGQSTIVEPQYTSGDLWNASQLTVEKNTYNYALVNKWGHYMWHNPSYNNVCWGSRSDWGWGNNPDTQFTFETLYYDEIYKREASAAAGAMPSIYNMAHVFDNDTNPVIKAAVDAQKDKIGSVAGCKTNAENASAAMSNVTDQAGAMTQRDVAINNKNSAETKTKEILVAIATACSTAASKDLATGYAKLARTAADSVNNLTTHEVQTISTAAKTAQTAAGEAEVAAGNASAAATKAISVQSLGDAKAAVDNAKSAMIAAETAKKNAVTQALTAASAG